MNGVDEGYYDPYAVLDSHLAKNGDGGWSWIPEVAILDEWFNRSFVQVGGTESLWTDDMRGFYGSTAIIAAVLLKSISLEHIQPHVFHRVAEYYFYNKSGYRVTESGDNINRAIQWGINNLVQIKVSHQEYVVNSNGVMG